jgi:hypothetical protein
VRPTLPTKHKEAFVLVPRTTPAVFELDPRGEPSAPPPNDDPPSSLSPAESPSR